MTWNLVKWKSYSGHSPYKGINEKDQDGKKCKLKSLILGFTWRILFLGYSLNSWNKQKQVQGLVNF